MWKRPCASLCNTCGVSPSDACHRICAPATGAPFAFTTWPPRLPGFCFGTFGNCARAPTDTNAAAHTRHAIFTRLRRTANRLPDKPISQFYIEELQMGLPVMRDE